MPEFSAGNTLLPQLPPSIEELRARVEAIQRSNREREAQADQGFIDSVQFLTGVDLTDLIARGRRAEDEKRVISVFDVVVLDSVPRVASSSNPDGGGSDSANGNLLTVNQNGQVTGAVGGNQKLPPVSMLPMWNADP